MILCFPLLLALHLAVATGNVAVVEALVSVLEDNINCPLLVFPLPHPSLPPSRSLSPFLTPSLPLSTFPLSLDICPRSQMSLVSSGPSVSHPLALGISDGAARAGACAHGQGGRPQVC